MINPLELKHVTCRVSVKHPVGDQILIVLWAIHSVNRDDDGEEVSIVLEQGLLLIVLNIEFKPIVFSIDLLIEPFLHFGYVSLRQFRTDEEVLGNSKGIDNLLSTEVNRHLAIFKGIVFKTKVVKTQISGILNKLN